MRAVSTADLATSIERIAQDLNTGTDDRLRAAEEAVRQLRSRMADVQALYRAQGLAQAFVPDLQAQIDRVLPALSSVRPDVLANLQDLVRSLIVPT